MLALLVPAARPTPPKTTVRLQITRLQDVADRLYRLVVNEENADAYRHDMGLLLNLSAAYQLSQISLGPERARH